MTRTWLGVWTRAVIGPAYRRAGAVWGGCAIVAAIILGPTAMHPRDITRMALHEPGVLAVLGVTWLLLFVPIARALLHADEARYLRSLPAPSFTPRLVQLGAIVGLQLPWLLLWLVGEHARGLAIFGASTAITITIAWWRPTLRASGTPSWRSPVRALVGVYLAALTRRAGDALVRGAGLAIVAGLAGGLFVRNNVLVGEHAARIAASVIALVAVPAQAGVLGVLLDAHRRSTWLARSLGIAPSIRTLALAVALAVLHVGGALLAIAGATIVLVTATPITHTNIPEVALAIVQPSTIVWIAATCFGCAVGSAIGATRVVLGANHALDDRLADVLDDRSDTNRDEGGNHKHGSSDSYPARDGGAPRASERAASESPAGDGARRASDRGRHASARGARRASDRGRDASARGARRARDASHPASVSVRMAIGSLVVSVATIASLALFGALAGVAALTVIAGFVLVRHPREENGR